jgi:transcription termination factor NusB
MRDLLEYFKNFDRKAEADLVAFLEQVQEEQNKLYLIGAADERPEFIELSPKLRDLLNQHESILKKVSQNFIEKKQLEHNQKNPNTPFKPPVMGQDDLMAEMEEYVLDDIYKNGTRDYDENRIGTLISNFSLVIQAYKQYASSYGSIFNPVEYLPAPELKSNADQEEFERVSALNNKREAENKYANLTNQMGQFESGLTTIHSAIKAGLDQHKLTVNEFKADQIIDQLLSKGEDALESIKTSILKIAFQEGLLEGYLVGGLRSSKVQRIFGTSNGPYDIDLFFKELELKFNMPDGSSEFKNLVKCFFAQKQLLSTIAPINKADVEKEVVENELRFEKLKEQAKDNAQILDSIHKNKNKINTEIKAKLTKSSTEKLKDFSDLFRNQGIQHYLNSNPKPVLKKFIEYAKYAVMLTITIGLYGLFKSAPASPNQRYAKEAERTLRRANGMNPPRAG